jgi:hypothetical protein
VVSDSAIASRVKSARQAIGDDGKAQRFIRTLHGQGFRFVAEVRPAAPQATDPPALQPIDHGSRPSIRCCRSGSSVTPDRTQRLQALPHDLIASCHAALAVRHRARSSFRLRAQDADMGEIGRLLGVNYRLTGTVDISAHTSASRSSSSTLERRA